MRFALSISVLAVGVVVAGPAAAQQESAPELFQRSVEAYRDGRFREAADLLRRAHEIDPAPILQYNLARALEGLGDIEGAVAAYEAYLEGEPDARDRGSIEARLRTLRRQIAEREALAAAARREAAAAEQAEGGVIEGPGAPERQTSAPLPSGRRSTAGGPSAVPWVLAGVGVAALGVAVGLGAVAQETNDSAAREPQHERRVALVDEAHGYALAANVTFAMGGAFALAGLIWGIVDVSSAASDDVEVALGPGSVAIRGSF